MLNVTKRQHKTALMILEGGLYSNESLFEQMTEAEHERCDSLNPNNVVTVPIKPSILAISALCHACKLIDSSYKRPQNVRELYFTSK